MRERVAKWLRSLRSLYIDIPVLRPGTVGAYILAIVAVGAATVLRVALDPYIEGAQFVTFYPAIVITTLISGFGAGFLCAMLSTAAVDFFLLEPRFSFLPESSLDLVSLLVFGPFASYLVIIVARMRYAIEAEQVEASKNRLQLALDAARLGWWQYDVPNRAALWSDKRSKEIYDVVEDKTDIEEFTKRVHPDDVRRVWAAMEAALDPTDPKPYAIEYRVQRGDEIRCVEAHGLTYFEGALHERRAVSMVGTAQDITERKDLEERERFLMREISHRAKNMLTVVNAIARQSVAKNAEDFIECFSERIQALSASQDLLIRDDWRGVEIADLVRAQLAPFVDHIGARIVVRGPTMLRLNAAATQPIGLALHELATNAGKYGALSNDKGHLEIGWGTEGESFTMSWTEHDGPTVPPSRRRGFGTTVMKEMTERGVDGKVELDYAPSGVTWRLTCPAANVLEAREGFWGRRNQRATNPGKPGTGAGFATRFGAQPTWVREHHRSPRVEGTFALRGLYKAVRQPSLGRVACGGI